MPEVEVTAVGGLFRPAGASHYQPFARGQRLVMSDEDAALHAGAVRLIDARAPAPDAEEEAPQPGAIAVSDLDLDEGGTPVKELRRFANARRIDLHGASRRPDIVEAIEAWMTDPEGGEG